MYLGENTVIFGANTYVFLGGKTLVFWENAVVFKANTVVFRKIQWYLGPKQCFWAYTVGRVRNVSKRVF